MAGGCCFAPAIMVACAVYDPVAQSLTACTVTGSKKAVWHVMPLRDGRAVLLCGESAGDVADGEAAMGSVCLYEDGKVVEKMGSFLGWPGVWRGRMGVWCCCILVLAVGASLYGIWRMARRSRAR